MVAVRAFDRRAKAYLRALPAVAAVTDTRIYYTDEFREEALSRYEAGESPVRIFREAGLEPRLIGYKRVERCFARWRQAGHLDQPRDASVLLDGSAASGAEIPEDLGVSGSSVLSEDSIVPDASSSHDDGAPGIAGDPAASVVPGSGDVSRSRKPGRPRSKAAAPLDPRDGLIARQALRIDALERELQHLKQELATRNPDA